MVQGFFYYKIQGGSYVFNTNGSCKKGIFTKEMEIVAKDEQMSKEELMEKLAKGSIVIPANKNHKNIYPRAVGEGTRTKVNVNLGVSEDCCDYCGEMVKVQKAIEYGTDAIMDLSTFGDTKKFRKELVEKSSVMLGTVPMYDAVAKLGKNIKRDMTVEDLFKVVEEHCKME